MFVSNISSDKTTSTKSLPTLKIKNREGDAEMYGSDQTKFLTETNKCIANVQKFLSIKTFEFDDFLKKIGTLRYELAKTNQEKNYHMMGRRRNDVLSTVVSIPYYAERGLELLKNLEATELCLPDIAKTFDLRKRHLENPYLCDNQYKKYQIEYKSHQDNQIPLTRCYIAKGEYLPAHPLEAVVFPEQKCELSAGNYFFHGYASEFKEFLKCKTIDDIVQHDEYNQTFNKTELSEIAKNFSQKGENKLSREAFAAAVGKPIRGKADDGIIADKDSWLCVPDPNNTGKALGIGLCHPRLSEVTEILAEAKYEFSKYKETKNDKDTAFKHACNTIYLMAHAAPFMRGSAWSAEVAGTALMRDLFQKEDISFVKSNLDFMAFGKNSDDFAKDVKKFLQKY